MSGTTQNALFDDQFLEAYAGHSIMNDPKVALMELIANAWEAGATKVEILLPNENGDKFSILDNGHGMTEKHFRERFMRFGYRRTDHQGIYAEIPPENKNIIQRPAFGKNAKGKFAAFLFGNRFFVRTWRDNLEHSFEIFPNHKSALAFKDLPARAIKGHGTEIYVNKAHASTLTPEQARTEIGMRFLTDPHFEVFVNSERVKFSDIPEENIKIIEFEVDNFGKVKITIIDSNNTDKTTHQHGVAWWVNRRLVGECSWKGTGQEHLFDGRRVAAKRYTFIVEADNLKEKNAVLPDWTGFNPKNQEYIEVRTEVNQRIKEYILELTKESRAEVFNEIKSNNGRVLKEMPLISRGKWEDFVKKVQEECPSITDADLQRLSLILANLETTESKYGLIQQLAELNPDNLEDLNLILEKWNIDLAKIVLDELEGRLKLLEQLRLKVKSSDTNEVQELQPLFHRGLWIFGPEYETIEYTSNEGMTAVIQKIFGDTGKGSLNRPDFVVVPDGTVGFYGYSRYDDDDGGEIGIASLTIVELKKPGVPIGRDEMSQPSKYIEELFNKGLINDLTKIRCFVLGDQVKQYFALPITERDKQVKIIPLDYDTVIKRAKSRLLNLHQKVSSAPFLKETRIEEFLLEKSQPELIYS